jgi:hypothetical protein
MNTDIKWFLRRHPLFYNIRFRIVSKKSSWDKVENYSYNSINPKKDIPAIYFKINKAIFSKIKAELTDIKKAKKIAKWLRNNTKGGPGLGKSSEKSLLKMLSGQGGVCSDITQVYNNFCVINDLKVKEWGLKISSNNPRTMGGHSFNEVYSKEFQKWILIDVSKSITFHKNGSKIPLSVFEIIAMKKENTQIDYCGFNKKIFPDNKRINELYLISNIQAFLISNYRNKTYDFFLNKLGFLPESIIHGFIFLIGKSYVFEFPLK